MRVRLSRSGGCIAKDCGATIHSRRLCNKHYRRILANIKPKRSCGCGCGELTRFIYKHGHHTRLFSSAEQSRRGQMNTGDKMRGTGEGKTYTKLRRRHEHRVVMEQKLGRPLVKGEIVHHKDHNKKNNAPENLELMSQAEHARHHLRVYWAERKERENA